MQRDLAAGRIDPVDEETELAMYAALREGLAAAGLCRYEISNYAREGREARHNRAYWRGSSYLGIGAGAHSHAARGPSDAGWGARWSKP